VNICRGRRAVNPIQSKDEKETPEEKGTGFPRGKGKAHDRGASQERREDAAGEIYWGDDTFQGKKPSDPFERIHHEKNRRDGLGGRGGEKRERDSSTSLRTKEVYEG